MKEQKLILLAYVKGAAHATIFPILIMVLVNHLFGANWGGAAALLYYVLPTVVYHYRDDKDLSKQAFQYITTGIFIFVVMIALLVVMSAYN